MNKNRKISKKLVLLAVAVVVAGTAAGWKLSRIHGYGGYAGKRWRRCDGTGWQQSDVRTE